MSTSYTEQEHDARRERRDGEARAYPHDTSARTIGQLVADATQDVSSIVRNEIQLAKSEMTADVAKVGKGVGMFVAAGVFAFLALIMLLHFLAWALVALGLATWLAYLIVAVVLLLVAGILAFVGKGALAKAKLKPERSIRNAQETVEALKPARPSASGSATNTSAGRRGDDTYRAASTSTHATTATGGSTVAGATSTYSTTPTTAATTTSTSTHGTVGSDSGATRVDA